MSVSRAYAVLALAALCGCNNLGFQGQRTPFGAGAGAAPAPQRGVNGATARSGATTAETKVVCRTTGFGTGWIAIDYLSDSEGCKQVKGGSAHPVALVVNYERMTVNSELEVCAPEHIPRGWIFDSWVESEGRCPDDGGNDSPEITKRLVKRIRRVD